MDRQGPIFSLDELPNLIRVPLVRQSTNYTCGVAALQSVLAFYGRSLREDNLARLLESGPEHGTNYHKIVEVAQSLGFDVDIFFDLSLDELRTFLDASSPVILAIQAWSDEPARYASEWEDGHYVVAVGYDAERVYFMDPSTLGQYTYIENRELLFRWHDMYMEDEQAVRLHHFALVIAGNSSAYDPATIVPMR